MTIENNIPTLKTKPHRALLVCCISLFFMPFMISAVNVALPNIGISIGASAVDLGFIATAYVVTVNIFALLAGRISDLFGRRRIFLFGMCLCTLATLALTLASSVAIFIFLRVFQGIGAAMISTVGMTILMSVIPQKDRGKAFGLASASVYGGISCGPVVGGFLTDSLGWQSIFLAGVPLGIFGIVMIITSIKDEWREAVGEAFDFQGAFIFGGAMILITLGTTLLEKSPYAWGLVILGLVAFVLFFFLEKRITFPIIDVGIFTASKAFTLGCLITWINFAAVTTFSMLLTFYVQVALGYKPSEAGLLLMIQPLLQMLLSPIGGQLADKFTANRMAFWGVVLCSLAMLLSVGLHGDSSLVFIIVLQVIMGIALAIFVPANVLALMSSVEQRYISIASGIANTMGTLGMVTCMQAMTIVFSIFMHGQAIEPASADSFLEGMHVDLMLFAAFSMMGVVLSFLRLKTPAGNTSNKISNS